ncbi:MAG TPA: type VI secretion protein, partial [Streptomyces sp.]
MARQEAPRTGRGEQPGGIPDGLLIGLLVFLLGLTMLAWTATGLAGLFTHGAWPEGVTVTRTPPALRALATQPHDIAGAWPDTPAEQLSGYGLFWGLFIGELMVLVVLTVFVLGVLARWRLVRVRRREEGSREVPVLPEPPSYEQRVPGTAEPALAEAAAALVPAPRTPLVFYGSAADRRPTVVQAIRDAEGPVLVVTSDPTVWAETKDARGKLGPVLVYDPGHLCDTPARLHWSPTGGCEDPAVAAARATALLAPV